MTIKFTKSHEWVEELGDGKVRLGISDHAQQAMGDLVFVNLPQVDDTVVLGESFADVESVKAVSDVYSPVSGVVVAVNEALLDAPELINENPYDAWFIEVDQVSETEELLSEEAYQQLLAEEA